MGLAGRRTTAVALLLVAGAPAIAHAQAGGAPHRGDVPNAAGGRVAGERRGIELWAGLARRSPTMGVLGDTPGMDLALTAVRWSRRLRTGRRLAVDQVVEVVPLALLSPPLVTAAPMGGERVCTPGAACPFQGGGRGFPPGRAVGAGLAPLGIAAVLRPTRRVQPVLSVTGGALWFDRRVPTTAASRFNFTAAAEAGVRLIDVRGRGAVVTYRFHHLSNAGTAPANPAVASHVLSVGVRWRAERAGR